MNQSKTDFLGQLIELTICEIKARYRKTVAGFIWVLLNPIIMFGIQAFAFKTILRLKIDDYYLFLLSGLIPWILITQSIQMSVNTFLNKGSLLKSFHLNPIVLILSVVLNNFINFMIAFFLLLVPIISISDFNPVGIPLLSFGMLILLLGCILICWFFATVQVFYQDLEFVVSFLNTILFFVTPIFFSKEFMPEKFLWLVDFNPFYMIIEPFRLCLYKFELYEFLFSFSKAVAFLVFVYIVTSFYWKRKKDELYFRI